MYNVRRVCKGGGNDEEATVARISKVSCSLYLQCIPPAPSASPAGQWLTKQPCAFLSPLQWISNKLSLVNENHTPLELPPLTMLWRSIDITSYALLACMPSLGDRFQGYKLIKCSCVYSRHGSLQIWCWYIIYTTCHTFHVDQAYQEVMIMLMVFIAGMALGYTWQNYGVSILLTLLSGITGGRDPMDTGNL